MSDEVADLPEGWELVTAGEIAEVVGGGTPKTTVAGNFTDDGGHPWLTPADLTGYTAKYVARGRRNITDQGLATSGARYMPTGTVLFSSRAPIGYVAIAANSVTTNQGFRSFVPSERIDSEYLYYALKRAVPEAEHLASGTTFAELSGTKAKSLQVPLAPLPVQRQVVELLDAATEYTASATAHVAAARRLIWRFRQTVLMAACAGRLTEEWRADHPDSPSVEHALAKLAGNRESRAKAAPVPQLEPPGLPDAYLVATIGEAATLIEYGTSKKSNDDITGIPVLRMGNITDAGLLRLDDLKYANSDAEIKKLTLHNGDLLFNRTNSPEKVGKSAVFHEPGDMSFASYLIRVRFDPEVADPDFVNFWINSAWGKQWARHVKTDGVSQSNINGTKLAAMPLPLPPIEEQREIVSRAAALLELADETEERVARALTAVERSARAVLTKAFHGELTPAGDSV
jgi:type I restriction enzyme S subunit